MSGERLEMDDAGRGYLVNAVGYVEPGVWVEGKRVERIDDKTYRVEGGRFTSCSQPNPRWGFEASSAEIEIDEKVKAKNAVFKVKGVPVFYLPYMYYPISNDGRSTGVLFPHFGYSSYRGFNDGDRLLLGDGPQRRPDLLRRLLVEDRLRLRARAALRPWRAFVRQLPHLRLRRGGRREARLRPRLERAADPARQREGDRQRPPVQRPPVPAAVPGRLQPGHEPHAALVGVAREGPEARGALRLRRHHEHLLRHGLHARQRPAAGREPAALPAPDRLGQGGGRAPGQGRPDPVRQRGAGRQLVADRRRPLRLAALRAELPASSPRRWATATRATARATG